MSQRALAVSVAEGEPTQHWAGGFNVAADHSGIKADLCE